MKPTPNHAIAARNALLQRSLRDEPPLFPIEAEYPIVLGGAGLEFSHCLLADDGTPLCHANLWPRVLVDRSFQRRFNVALIGNVATDAVWRGRGLMRSLFAHLKAEAERRQLVAAFLWSDLTQFYQNLGFHSLSRERRYWLAAKPLRALPGKTCLWREENGESLDTASLDALNRLRTAADCTLDRTADEFQRLLAIPNTKLFVGWQGQQEIAAYFIVGKGVDMGGVAHEWGARDPLCLLQGVGDVCEAYSLGELMLLCPETAAPKWHQAFQACSLQHESHDMAHVKIYQELPGLREALARCFIWGLDSI